MRQLRLAWGAAGVLLAALALGACSKPVGGPGVEPVAGATGATTSTASAAPSQQGIGLHGGLGTGMTGSFPATSTATSATTLGNNGGSSNSTTGSAVGQRP